MTSIQLTLNGEAVSADVPPRTHLGDFLREQMRLTGTHLGCEHGVCGACTVLVDDMPVRSCITFAVACDGQSVRTIEGFDDDPVMAELREAFTREHALQCGFCTPGMLITARDIVLRLPNADEARIRQELSGNLCRCTGYLGIVKAVGGVIERRREAGIAPAPKPAAASSPAAVRPSAEAAPRAEPAPAAAPIPASLKSAGATSGTGRQGWTRFAESFVIHREPDEVWRILADFPTVASCIPGAELLEHDERQVKGRMIVKLGPIQAAFAGSALIDRDDTAFTGTIRGAGSDGGSGSRTKADATYQVTRAPDGNGSVVSVVVEYNLQGPLAQFSRSGLAQDLGRRIVGDFAANLNARLGAGPAAAKAPAATLDAGNLFWGALTARLRAWWKKITGR